MKRTSSSCCCARLASHGPRELEASLRDTADSRAFAHQASRISGSQGRTTWTSCCKCRTASHRPTKRPMCSLRSAPPAPVRPLRWSRLLRSALISPRPHVQPGSRRGRAHTYAHDTKLRKRHNTYVTGGYADPRLPKIQAPPTSLICYRPNVRANELSRVCTSVATHIGVSLA